MQPSATPHAPTTPLKVMLADDHRITLWGIQTLIDGAQPRMRCIGTAGSLDELLAAPALAEADVLLLDLDLNGESGLDALPEITRRTAAKVLVLSGEDDPEIQRETVLRGARGMIHKSAPTELLLRAIEVVAAGEIWLEAKLLGQVFVQLAHGGPATPVDSPQRRIASLTVREREIVVALSQQVSSKLLAVADELGMSEHTLRNHLTTIYSKLGVRGRLQLHVYATQHRIGVPLGAGGKR